MSLSRPGPTQDSAYIKYELERFLTGGEFRLSDESGELGHFNADSSAIETRHGRVVLSCWKQGWAHSWRIVAIEPSDDAIVLHCAIKLGRETSTLRAFRGRGGVAIEASRAAFRDELSRLINRELAGWRVSRAVVARDDPRHLSGRHVRLLLEGRNARGAGVGVSHIESQSTVDSSLGAGLVWLDALRGSGGEVDRLFLFVPRGCSRTIAARMSALKNRNLISLHEVDPSLASLSPPLAACDQGHLGALFPSLARGAMWPSRNPPDEKTRLLIDSITGLAPEAIDWRERGRWIVFSIRGLEFARLSRITALIEYGVLDRWKRIDPSDWAELGPLAKEIASARGAPAGRQTLLGRVYPERWLEAAVCRNILLIDPTINPGHVYSQVPAYRGEQRTFIDLLALTRSGKLVIAELKVAEDPEFPFQALDYWLRVEWHRRRGDFQRRGPFQGVNLLDAPPIIYLVAPVFRFHATTSLLAGGVDADIPVIRIGVNQNWRNRLTVVCRDRLN